jgi:ribosome-binding factor A
MKYRQMRVGDLIRKELSILIEREIETPLGSLVTISDVEVDKKYERALVMISVIPTSATETVMATLEKARGYLYHLLFKKLNIKPMPDIMFRLDKGLENAANVERMLLNDVAPKPSKKKVEKKRSVRRMRKK